MARRPQGGHAPAGGAATALALGLSLALGLGAAASLCGCSDNDTSNADGAASDGARRDSGGGGGKADGGSGKTDGGGGKTDTGGGAGDGGGGGSADAGPPKGWLYTKGNHLYLDGVVWRGRGANIHDTRSCNACTWGPPNVAEVKRRIDELVAWGANFIRLDLESYGSADGRTHYKPLTDDPGYFADIQDIIAHIGKKPGVYVLLSFWADPTFSALGWPTAQTIAAWRVVAKAFANERHVLYGLCNEPEHNFDGKRDPEVWKAMNDAVAAIRKVESDLGAPRHIVAVQGTGGWARRLDYYVKNPITAGGGANVAYEVHVYNGQADFQKMLVDPAKTLPVIIGEFGPFQTIMRDADILKLTQTARALDIPHLAWTFHMRCPPNLLVDPGVGCGVGLKLEPTGWGKLFKAELGVVW